MNRRSSVLGAFGALSVTAAVGLGGAVAASSHDGGSSPLGSPAVTSPSATQPTYSSLATGAEVSSVLLAKLEQSPAAARFALDFKKARVIGGESTRGQTILVPGATAMCLFVIRSEDDGGGTCQTPQDTGAGKLFLERRAPDQTSIVGVAPDGVAEAQLSTAQGGSYSVPVTRNAYGFTGPHVNRVAFVP